MNHSETRMQIALVRWWGMTWRSLGAPSEEVLVHIPNGGRRDKRSASILKAMGARAGLPDIFLFLPRRHHVGLALELKSSAGRLSEEQKTMSITLCLSSHFCWLIASELEEAQHIIRNYLAGQPVRP